ncbi:MAG TPA: pyridoxamine 5'-phosphate oxidase family protein [Steroidobacteraceae bacterium]
MLSKPLMAHLASVSPEGPRHSPVWFLWESPVLWLIGRSTDGFVRRLCADARCAVGVVDFDAGAGRLRHVGIRGTAELRPMDEAILARLLSRYLGPERACWRADFVTRVVQPLDALLRVSAQSVICREQSYFR